MASRVSELVLGCRDPEVLARFWCAVLDFVVLDREEDGSLEIGPREGFGGPQPTIILSRRDEPEKGKSRLVNGILYQGGGVNTKYLYAYKLP